MCHDDLHRFVRRHHEALARGQEQAGGTRSERTRSARGSSKDTPLLKSPPLTILSAPPPAKRKAAPDLIPEPRRARRSANSRLRTEGVFSEGQHREIVCCCGVKSCRPTLAIFDMLPSARDTHHGRPADAKTNDNPLNKCQLRAVSAAFPSIGRMKLLEPGRCRTKWARAWTTHSEPGEPVQENKIRATPFFQTSGPPGRPPIDSQ